MTRPLKRSAISIMRMRGNRSTTTPPISRNNSIGIWESTSTVPMAVAEPVSSSTHHASAMRYRLSPRREMVCPTHKRAKGRCVSERRTFIPGSIAPVKNLRHTAQVFMPSRKCFCYSTEMMNW